MSYNPQNPLIVQGDGSVLLEVDNLQYAGARDMLARFAELVKSPEYIHTYRITPLSLWNAASSGLKSAEILDGLSRYCKYPLPDNVRVEIQSSISRYGMVKLVRRGDDLLLTAEDPIALVEIGRRKELAGFIQETIDDNTVRVDGAMRGHIKRALVQAGFPAEDLAGYVNGEALPVALRGQSLHAKPFNVRAYQQEAADIFYAGGAAYGGSGVVVLPCGAGKTIVGMAAMAQTQCNTLILTPNSISVRQWIDELVDKTSLTPDLIGEYTGDRKEIRPVTISTYQTMTYRKRGTKPTQPLSVQHPHFALFGERDWGLIIYDEVHLLPAPVFRITADLQARRRLGLTATLVREDGAEEDVFSLIGPKKYDVPWKDLERQGWIAQADVVEVRIPLPDNLRMDYALAEHRDKQRIAAENPQKLVIVDELLDKHMSEQTLIIGMYLDQLEQVQRRFGYPLITGKTKNRERQALYDQFRSGEVKRLIISKVGNFAIDLPEASVMIQISGTFGSRQEEAQRVGRILRPKSDGRMAHFYTIVTKDTQDQEFSANRQRFLTEQGYQYMILYHDEVQDYTPRELPTRADA